MRVVVTGSSGLLGRHVVAALAEDGHDVLGIDLAPPPPGAPGTHATADVTDLGALVQLTRGAEALLHVAAIPRPVGRDAGTVFRTNVLATYNAVEAAVIGGVRRFVYASSFSVLGYPFFDVPVRPAVLPVDETAPVGAQDAYGLSKWLGEEIVEAAVRRDALSAVSLRMPWIQTPDTFWREVGPRRRTAESSRDLWAYLDARDAASAFVAATERPLDGHRRLFLGAEDTYADEPTEVLATRAFPDVVFRRPIPGRGALIDTSAGRALLGWAPRHAWRAYPTGAPKPGGPESGGPEP